VCVCCVCVNVYLNLASNDVLRSRIQIIMTNPGKFVQHEEFFQSMFTHPGPFGQVEGSSFN
jgi:hypothetical protein